MIIDDTTIRPIEFRKTAFRDAQLHYLSFPRIKFEDDFLWYCEHSYVHIEPDLFVMFCMIDVAPLNANYVEPAWFVRYARGDVSRIVEIMPFPLKEIYWCRNDEDRLRKYRTRRVIALRRVKQDSARKNGNSRPVPHRTVAGQAGSTPAAEIKTRKVKVT